VAERRTPKAGIFLSSHLVAEGGPCSVKFVCILDVTTKWRTISVTLRSLSLGSWLKVGRSLDGPRFVLNERSQKEIRLVPSGWNQTLQSWKCDVINYTRCLVKPLKNISSVFIVPGIPNWKLPFAEDVYALKITLSSSLWKSCPRECFFKAEIPEHYGYRYLSVLPHAELQKPIEIYCPKHLHCKCISITRFSCCLLFCLKEQKHCGTGVDSSSNRNECQEYLLGGKGGPCVGLITLPPSCTDCLEIVGASISWNHKDLSRPLMGLLKKSWRYFLNCSYECCG
jgi:hypothetical protein